MEKPKRKGKPSLKSDKELEAQRKVREQKLKEIASQDIEELETESTSEREFNKKANKIIKFVRKSLLVVRARKQTHQIKGEDYFNSVLDVLERATNL